MTEGGIANPYDQLKMTDEDIINYLKSTGMFQIKPVGTPERQIADGSNYFKPGS